MFINDSGALRSNLVCEKPFFDDDDDKYYYGNTLLPIGSNHENKKNVLTSKRTFFSSYFWAMRNINKRSLFLFTGLSGETGKKSGILS